MLHVWLLVFRVFSLEGRSSVELPAVDICILNNVFFNPLLTGLDGLTVDRLGVGGLRLDEFLHDFRLKFLRTHFGDFIL